MRRVILLVMLVAGVIALKMMARPVPPPPGMGPGISLTMAEDRAARLRDLAYTLALDIPRDQQAPITGSITARFHLTDADAALALDFGQPAAAVHSVTVNGSVIADATIADGHIVVPSTHLTGGQVNDVTVTFTAGDASLNRQADLLYALFVPARAHLALPVFDQPDLKARWTIALTLPDDWAAVSNGAEVSRTPGTTGKSTVQFASTEPLPTYLVTFAAGRFQVETADRNGRTYRMLHRETDATKVARNRDAIFDLHATALAWLEDYTAQPYGFGKFDFVLIPSFQFGGMEHPGAVFYNASSLLLDESASQNQRLGRASLIAHETAHMWFGDLVTMRWFNDVWMKEVFANFMAAKIVNPTFPDVNHDLRFLFSHYPAAYDVDRTDGANPIRQPLDNLREAGSLYGAIIYQKAPIVMRQLELLMGVDAFRDGLREYLRNHAMANATWSDLIAILDARTPADLVAWSRAWVEERGRPQVNVQLQRASDGRTTVSITSTDPRGRQLVWPQALRLILGAGTTMTGVDVALGDTGATQVTLDTNGFPDGPRWVLPTGGGLGYGDFVLPADSLQQLVVDLPLIRDPLTRGAAVVTLWESMLEGRVSPATMLDVLLRSVGTESDELNLSRQLGYLQSAWWRFTDPQLRSTRAPEVEATLRAGLEATSGTSRRNVWFGAIRNTATTPATIQWLTRIWQRDEVIRDLPLSEADETELAAELALRGVDKLDAQAARIQNPDRKARFSFVRPALSADPAVRKQLFESFRDVNNRRREAWVLEAMGYIHHPLRAAESEVLVVPALELVREIRDTGDIFFPKRWADATLGGHRSSAVADQVRTFINERPPAYPERLRWVLLASADSLFRAATLAR